MSKPRPGILSISEWVAAGLMTAIALCLHIARVHSAGPLWRDEIAVLNLARMNWHEIVTGFQHEGFPLLFPALLREYAGLLGTGNTALRVFGFGTGVLCLGIVWLNAACVTRRTPLIALALFAFNPVFFVWGDSIRGYGMGAALLLLTLALFARAIIEPGPGVFCAAMVSAVLSVQCLLANAVLLLAIGASAMAVQILQRQVRAALTTLGIGCGAALSISPYLESYRNAREWDVLFRSAVGLPWLWRRFCSALGDPSAGMLWVWLVLFAASAIGVLRLLQRNPTRAPGATPLAVFALLVCVLAPICYFVFLETLGYPTQDWYYLSLVAVLALALDIATGVLAGKFVGVAALRLALAVAVAGALVAPAFDRAQDRMSNMDLVAARLKQKAGPADFIVIAPWYLGISFRWHYRFDGGWQTLPPISDLRIHRYDLLKEQMTKADPLGGLRKRVADTLRSGHRLWVVGSLTYPRNGETPPSRAPAPHDRVGWRESAYLTAWSMQMGQFVQTHALRSRVIPIAAPTPVNAFENVRLTVVEGWRGE